MSETAPVQLTPTLAHRWSAELSVFGRGEGERPPVHSALCTLLEEPQRPLSLEVSASVARAARALAPCGHATRPRQLTRHALKLIEERHSARVQREGRSLLPSDPIKHLRALLWSLQPPQLTLEAWREANPLESPAEEAFVERVFVPLMGLGGLSLLRAQVSFQRRGGGEGRSDFVMSLPQGELAIEIDGRAYHGEGHVSSEDFDRLTKRNNDQQEHYLKVFRLTAQQCLQGSEGLELLKHELLQHLHPYELAKPHELPSERAPNTQALPSLLSAWPVWHSVGQQLALRALSDPSREARRAVHLEGPHAWALALGWLDALLTEAHMGQLENAEPLWRDVELSAQSAPGDERELCRGLLKSMGFEQEPTQAPTQEPTGGHDLERWTLTQTIHQEARRVRLTFGERCEAPAEVCIWSVNSSPLASTPPNAQRQRRVWQVRFTCLVEPNTHMNWRANLIHELLRCGGLQLADSAWASLQAAREAPRCPRLISPNPNERSGRYLLWRTFGYDRFREGQWDIIKRTLSGRSSLGVLPTGAGKSVCFQLPGLILGGLTLVVSPLVSLIKDQVEGLEALGVPGVRAITGSTDEQARRWLREELRARAVTLLYVSPERLQMESFLQQLRELKASGALEVTLFTLDEAHIASEWGHGFRPSYLSTPRRYQELTAPAPLSLLTATASKNLRADLMRLFKLTPEVEVRPKSFLREELSFEVVTAADEQARKAALAQTLKERLPQRFAAERRARYEPHQDLASALLDMHQYVKRYGRASYEQGGLIFTPYAQDSLSEHQKSESLRVYELQRWLNDQLLKGSPPNASELRTAVSAYSSSLSEETRFNTRRQVSDKERDQARFLSNQSALMVATKGFGMGIDKPNLRYVIHTSLAGSIEGYYQEVGRAGRDREASMGVLLHAPRAPACLAEHPRGAPPCIDQDLKRPPKGEEAPKQSARCPYGLTEGCSYGTQAFLTYQEAKPPIERLTELFEALELIWRESSEALTAGGGFELPLKQERSGLDRGLLMESLGHLQALGVVREFNEHSTRAEWVFVQPVQVTLKGLKERFLKRWPTLSSRLTPLHDLGALIECGLLEGLELSVGEAMRGASLWFSHLSKKRSTGDKLRLTLQGEALSHQQQRAQVVCEHVLYQLNRLGLIQDYLKRSAGQEQRWWVSVEDPTTPHKVRARLTEHLRELIPLTGAQLKRRLQAYLKGCDEYVARCKIKLGELEGAELRAMTMGALHTMVLVSDEVITTQRWQMLNNHERYATETGCRTQLMLNMLGAEDSLDGPCERCDNCGVTPLYELKARRMLRAESQESQERALGPHERRQLALKAWRAELVELLMGGFYDQAPSRRPLEALTTHVNAYPQPLKPSATSSHEGWRELEGRTRGLLEEQPEDLFFNMALCLSLGAQGDTRARWSSEASLLLLIERSFDEPKARLQALEALPHPALLQLLWTRAPHELKLLPRLELLRLLKGVYGDVD